MKESLKKYWKNLLAFAVGGAMCLGMGIFVLASPSTQTQLDNNSSTQLFSEVTENSGELLLVSENGQNSNGGTSKGVYLTVSQWNTVYGDSSGILASLVPDDDDPAGQAIWQEIQNSAIYGNVTIYTVTFVSSTPDNTSSTTIQVVENAPIEVDGKILTIAGTTFTISEPTSGSSYVWGGWSCKNTSTNATISTMPSTITQNLTFTATYQVPFTATVSITGTAKSGQTLTASVSGNNSTYTLQWYSNDTASNSGGTAISSATSATYALTDSYIGKYIYVVATSSNSNYSGSVATAVTAAVTAATPWVNSGVYDSGIWTGYTWVTFDNSTNWIIIGSGSNNPLNLTSGKGTQNGSNDLSANQILLLSENLVANSVQYNSSTSETAWTSTTLCTYLNNSDNYDDWGISTSLYSSSSIATPTLTTMKNSDDGNMQTPSNDDYDDTKKIFTLAYGYSGENFCLATYLGGNVSYDENYIANYGDDPSTWWLRSGSSGTADFACIVISLGSVNDGLVVNSYGVRPAFILNI